MNEKTLLEGLKIQLKTMGLFDDMVESVIPLIIEDESTKELKDRWNDLPSGYGTAPILSMAVIMAKPIVLAWLEENHPQAWFKPMFYSGKKFDEFFKGMKS